MNDNCFLNISSHTTCKQIYKTIENGMHRDHAQRINLVVPFIHHMLLMLAWCFGMCHACPLTVHSIRGRCMYKL